MSSMPAALLATTHPQGPQDSRMALARLWLELDAARVAVARGRGPAVVQTARALIAALTSPWVRAELERAAAAFAHGLDERPDAE